MPLGVAVLYNFKSGVAIVRVLEYNRHINHGAVSYTHLRRDLVQLLSLLLTFSFVSGWKGKGMDTKVSLKQALKALGFAGGTKKESELNQCCLLYTSVMCSVAVLPPCATA